MQNVRIRSNTALSRNETILGKMILISPPGVKTVGIFA